MIRVVGFLYVLVAFMLRLSVFKIRPLLIQLQIYRLRIFEFGSLRVYVDFYSVLYLFVLFSIVGRIHFFIEYYMKTEENLLRFVMILNLFVLSMVVLIISPNLVFLVLG